MYARSLWEDTVTIDLYDAIELCQLSSDDGLVTIELG